MLQQPSDSSCVSRSSRRRHYIVWEPLKTMEEHGSANSSVKQSRD
jgi:hypothetical protein